MTLFFMVYLMKALVFNLLKYLIVTDEKMEPFCVTSMNVIITIIIIMIIINFLGNELSCYLT